MSDAVVNPPVPRVIVRHGDVLDERVDVLICSANPSLNMSGGVNGAILRRGGKDVQAELRAHLAPTGKTFVEPGTVVRTSPGPLGVGAILHAVAIDAFYESSEPMVQRTLVTAFEEAERLGARTLAVPALATGYGPLDVSAFTRALRAALDAHAWPFDEVRLVLRHAPDVEPARRALGI